MKRRARENDGAALIVALMMLLLAGTAAAALAELGRAALARARLGRDGARAWFLAEAGLADLFAATPPGASFTGLLGDAAVEASSGGEWAYRATIEDDRDDSPNDPAIDRNRRVRFRVVATGPSPIRRRLEAVVGRESAPLWPAAVVLDGSVSEMTTEFFVDGRDYGMADGCVTSGPGPIRFGLALPIEGARPSVAAEQVVGRGTSPSIVEHGPLDVASVADAEGTHYPSGALPGALGSLSSPRLSLVDGDADVVGGVTGAGMLFVDGGLHVEGTLEFIGVVAASGEIAVADGGTLRVCGGLWSGGDPALRVEGGGWVRASEDALAMATQIAPLPARPRIIAMRELF